MSVELGCTGLVELHFLLKAACLDGIQHPQYTDSISISGIIGHIEGYLDVTHGTKIVDLIRRT